MKWYPISTIPFCLIEKSCTLTITRPNGLARSYTSTAPFEKMYDARASACTIAIQSGAMDFILASESHSSTSGATLLELPPPPLEMSESVKEIEQCCLEVTGGKVEPFWLNINEPKFGRSAFV